MVTFKPAITRLFIDGGIAIIAGAMLAITAVWIAIANDVFVMNGPDIVGLQGGAVAWSLLGLGILGGIVAGLGFMAGFVAWIAALVDTWQLERKTWFAVLLLLGIFNLGFFAMIAYLIAGPDTAHSAPRTAPAGAGG
jgi:hypothetical protein